METPVQVDAQKVISAQARQIGDLSYRLAVAEATVETLTSGEDGEDGPGEDVEVTRH